MQVLYMYISTIVYSLCLILTNGNTCISKLHEIMTLLKNSVLLRPDTLPSGL